MKKLINSIKNKANSAIISARTAVESTAGEGYVDTGVKIIVGVVIIIMNYVFSKLFIFKKK